MEKRPAEMAHFLTSDGANVNSIFMEFDVNDVLTESIKIQKIFDLVWIHHEKENPLLFGLNDANGSVSVQGELFKEFPWNQPLK